MIHSYYYHIKEDCKNDYALLEKYLNSCDKNRYDKIINIKQKQQFLIARYLLNKLLSDYYNIDYKTLIINIAQYGKPYIANSNLCFNISHSSNLIIVAISNNCLGIDVEQIKAIDNHNLYNAMLDKVIHPYEHNFIKKTQIEDFYKAWCIKEAFCKYHSFGFAQKNPCDYYIIKQKLPNNISISLNNPQKEDLFGYITKIKDNICAIVSNQKILIKINEIKDISI
jgi:phosphopantetheinyl transferase